MARDIEALYKTHLSMDRKLVPLIQSVTLPVMKRKKNICLRLCASIMSQQLSTHVANVIYKRFLDLYDGVEPTPQQILDMPFEKLRAIGLSNAKVNYIQNVARFVIERNIDDKALHKMSNDEIIDTLTKIKGVGRWTVEMLLMFALNRDDVFAIDDLVVQKSMIKLYKLDTSDKKRMREKMLKISAKWAPYRTYACLYLWRHKVPDL